MLAPLGCTGLGTFYNIKERRFVAFNLSACNGRQSIAIVQHCECKQQQQQKPIDVDQ